MAEPNAEDDPFRRPNPGDVHPVRVRAPRRDVDGEGRLVVEARVSERGDEHGRAPGSVCTGAVDDVDPRLSRLARAKPEEREVLPADAIDPGPRVGCAGVGEARRGRVSSAGRPGRTAVRRAVEANRALAEAV